jgi:Domain of unknown function (DUF4917)
MTGQRQLPDRLDSWERLGNQNWPTLLIGNGASINIWDDFAYGQLLQRAQLTPAALQLFADLGTVNFEVVLEGLWHAERVLDALNRRRQDVAGLYLHVRAELVAAIGRVHAPWGMMPAASLTQIANVLNSHSLVFTLNYDLLTYWSVMNNVSSTYMGDFFWAQNNTFDISDSSLASGRTGLLYLHGGVHLWQDSITGLTGKWTNQGGGNLLSRLTDNLDANHNRQPLIVSEGTSAQKMSVIRRSDYLSFARQKLIDDISDTVVFGVSLGSQDDHIVTALSTGDRRRIAISIRPGTSAQNIAAMAQYTAKFPDQDLVFFDSRTHPLGDPSLHVPSL